MTALSALILLIPYLTLKPSSAADSPTATEFLNDAETIVSESSTFALGFSSAPNSTHRSVGIWYSKPSVKDVVWVANKNSPPNDSSGIFRVSKDGNLQVLNGKTKSFGHQMCQMLTLVAISQLLPRFWIQATLF